MTALPKEPQLLLYVWRKNKMYLHKDIMQKVSWDCIAVSRPGLCAFVKEKIYFKVERILQHNVCLQAEAPQKLVTMTMTLNVRIYYTVESTFWNGTVRAQTSIP